MTNTNFSKKVPFAYVKFYITNLDVYMLEKDVAYLINFSHQKNK